MGKQSGISWTDGTWNPWVGCEPVSPGCNNCYMFRDQRRYGRDPAVVHRTKPQTFYAPMKWEPSLVFTCSWSDFFIAQADEWREQAWELILQTDHHQYQVLTKVMDSSPRLRKPSAPITYEDTLSMWFKQLCIDLRQTAELLDKRPRGCAGLAAPQLGARLRVIVVFCVNHWEVMVNPEIRRTGHPEPMKEGCLSVPQPELSEVTRFRSISYSYRNEVFAARKQTAGNVLAQVVQHEVDHLDGKLFTDLGGKVIKL